MSLHDRTGNILEAVIREFIRTGEPVSSGFLYGKYDFGIRPARIRAELVALTDEGYLAQPHHSAGRIPSDRGYGFYAERVLREDSHTSEVTDLARLFFASRWDAFLGDLAEQLGVVGLVGSDAEEVRARGFEYLVRNLLADSREALANALHEIENIEERFNDLSRIFPEQDFVRVFIGKQVFDDFSL